MKYMILTENKELSEILLKRKPLEIYTWSSLSSKNDICQTERGYYELRGKVLDISTKVKFNSCHDKTLFKHKLIPIYDEVLIRVFLMINSRHIIFYTDYLYKNNNWKIKSYYKKW